MVDSAISGPGVQPAPRINSPNQHPYKQTQMSQATRLFHILCLSLLLISLGWAQTEGTSYLIDTVAGREVPRDAERAVETWLDVPVGVATDNGGNVYVADSFNSRVLRIKPDGTRETVVGNGFSGFSGDDGPATEAQLSSPKGLTFGPDGSLFIADFGNRRIRKVFPDGTITTVAGSGDFGFSGDGGPATAAALNFPWDVAVDSMGNLYIADRSNGRIRKVDAQGIISTFAGTGDFGSAGDGGPASAAQLAFPVGVAAGIADEVYIADAVNSRVRVVDTDGIINTFAGGGFSTDDGVPTDYRLTTPSAVAVDSMGAVYISNQNGQEICPGCR